jgi:hypothetical protein
MCDIRPHLQLSAPLPRCERCVKAKGILPRCLSLHETGYGLRMRCMRHYEALRPRLIRSLHHAIQLQPSSQAALGSA